MVLHIGPSHRTPVWWLFLIFIVPADYKFSGRLFLWCSCHRVWETVSKESRRCGWFWLGTPSCRLLHSTPWRQAFCQCKQEIQTRDPSTLLLIYDECIQVDQIS